LKGNNIATDFSKLSSDIFVLLRQLTSIVSFPEELKKVGGFVSFFKLMEKRLHIFKC